MLPEGEEREWFRQRLLPLLGIEATSTAEREELFTAWRRFLEQIAEADPTVLVFEDLHWADEAMLAFLEHLADLAEGVPLLLVGTARPELFERHPDYAAGLRNANTDQPGPAHRRRRPPAWSRRCWTRRCCRWSCSSRSSTGPVATRCMRRSSCGCCSDRDLLERAGSSWQLREGAEVPFPDSVQALIAARLDTLEPDAKSLLADAAVIGKVFWAGAVAAMGDRDPQRSTAMLRELSRKELVRPARQSSMAGEAEYAFWHVLARDVAYNQLPRASRATRHVAAAEWIESKGTGRVEDLADVLAYHYATALDLALAAGQHRPGQPSWTHRRCGSSALPGNARSDWTPPRRLRASSGRSTLTPPGHPDRAEALARFGEAAFHAGRNGDAKDALEEAIDAFQAAGDRSRGRPGDGHPRRCSDRLGDPRAWELPARGARAVGAAAARPRAVAALTEARRGRGAAGPAEAGLDYAEQALALADAARAAQARPCARLSRHGPLRLSVTGVGWTTSARRSCSPPRPGRAARSRSCTTTTRSRSGRSRAPAQPWRCCRPGSPSPRRVASPR